MEGLEQKICLLNAARAAAAVPARGWLRAVREATGVTQGEAASALAVKRQSFAQFEVAEEKETISLGSLRRAAGALDCELVYFIVPRGKEERTFAALARSVDSSASQDEATSQSMSLKAGKSAL